MDMARQLVRERITCIARQYLSAKQDLDAYILQFEERSREKGQMMRCLSSGFMTDTPLAIFNSDFISELDGDVRYVVLKAIDVKCLITEHHMLCERYNALCKGQTERVNVDHLAQLAHKQKEALLSVLNKGTETI